MLRRDLYYWRVHSNQDHRFDVLGTAESAQAARLCVTVAVTELSKTFGFLPGDLDKVWANEACDEVYWHHEDIFYEGTALSHLIHHPWTMKQNERN